MFVPFWRSVLILSNLVIRGGYVSWSPASVVSLGCYSPFTVRASPTTTGSHDVGFENCIACNTAFAIVRGTQCLCVSIEEYELLIRVEDSYCDITCYGTPDLMCGGNLGGNLFCNKFVNETLCYAESEQHRPVEKIYREFDSPNKSGGFESIEPCLDLGCGQSPSLNHLSYYEYFPNLTPEDCVIYCSYVATAYAHVGWLPVGKGLDFSPTCICSNSTSPPDEYAPECETGNCPVPLNPVDAVDRWHDDNGPSCGNKDHATPQYYVYCTIRAEHDSNGSKYCADFKHSQPPDGGWCNVDALTTQEAMFSSFTSQPTTSPPAECPERRSRWSVELKQSTRDDPGLEVQCDHGNCESPACSFNGSCYYFYELVTTPDDVDLLRNISASECMKKGGHLVAIETSDEQSFILQTFSDVMSQTYEPFLTSGIKDSANADPYWYYCDVKMPIETNNNWMMPFQDGDSYPSYLIIAIVTDNDTMEFTRCNVGSFYLCEFPEPVVDEQTTSGTTTESTTELSKSTTESETSSSQTTSMMSLFGTTDVPVLSTDDCPCTKVDYYGVLWIVPANRTKIKDCRRGAEGTASWTCDYIAGLGCKLRTDQPDYSNCHSLELENIANDVANNETDIEYVWEELYNFTGPNDQYFGHEIVTILDLVTKILDRQDSEFNGTDDHLEIQLNSSTTATQIMNNLLSHDVQWFQINQFNRSMTALELLSVSEDVAFRLIEIAELEERPLLCENNENNITISSVFWDGIQSSISGCQLNETLSLDELLRFPLAADSFIKLPENVLERGQRYKAAGVFVSHYLMQHLLPGGNNAMDLIEKQVNSPLISYTIGNRKQTLNLLNGTLVHLVFQHATRAKDPPVRTLRRALNAGEVPSAVVGSALCSFLAINSSTNENETSTWLWNHSGCEIYSSNKTHTICQCNHLTSFSSLMDFHDYIGDDPALDITSFICSSVSVVSLAITFTIFTILKAIRTDRTVITQNLCISLMLSHLMALTTLDRHYLNLDDVACASMGVLLHFALLVSFMWMGVEGVRLCRMVLYVFNLRDWTRFYLTTAYLVPTIVVTVTVLTAYYTTGVLEAYAGDETCWLNGANYKWSFAGPVSVIIMLNLVTVSIAIYSSWNLKQNAERSFNDKFRNAVAMSLSLTCLLGISWLSGFLLYAETIVFAYVFTITNGLQGFMMLVFRCALNEEVRTALNDRWQRRRNRKLGRWSSTTTKGTSSHRQHSPVAGRTLPRLYQTISTLSVQSNATKVTDVSMLPNPQDGPTRRHQTVRTVSGTEYFEDNISMEGASTDSDFSCLTGDSSQLGSPRRVVFVNPASSPDSPPRQLKHTSTTTTTTKYNSQMILVNRKTDMMPFTDLDPMMFY